MTNIRQNMCLESNRRLCFNLKQMELFVLWRHATAGKKKYSLNNDASLLEQELKALYNKLYAISLAWLVCIRTYSD